MPQFPELSVQTEKLQLPDSEPVPVVFDMQDMPEYPPPPVKFDMPEIVPPATVIVQSTLSLFVIIHTPPPSSALLDAIVVPSAM